VLPDAGTLSWAWRGASGSENAKHHGLEWVRAWLSAGPVHTVPVTGNTSASDPGGLAGGTAKPQGRERGQPRRVSVLLPPPPPPAAQPLGHG